MLIRLGLFLVLGFCLNMKASQMQASQILLAIDDKHRNIIEQHPNIQRLKDSIKHLESAHNENMERLKQMYDTENGLRYKKKRVCCFTHDSTQDTSRMLEIQQKIDAAEQEYQKKIVDLQEKANAEHRSIAAQDEYKGMKLMAMFEDQR